MRTSRTSTPLQGKVKGAIIREADREKNVLEGKQQDGAAWGDLGRRDEKNSLSENPAPMMNGVWERRLAKGKQPGGTRKGGLRRKSKENAPRVTDSRSSPLHTPTGWMLICS